MGEVTTAFQKFQGILIKLLPVAMVILGILSSVYILEPVAGGIYSFLQNNFNFNISDTPSIGTADVKQLGVWVAAGALVGAILGIIGGVVRSMISPLIGNLIVGFALGLMVGSVYIPFAKEIGWRWW